MMTIIGILLCVALYTAIAVASDFAFTYYIYYRDNPFVMPEDDFFILFLSVIWPIVWIMCFFICFKKNFIHLASWPRRTLDKHLIGKKGD